MCYHMTTCSRFGLMKHEQILMASLDRIILYALTFDIDLIVHIVHCSIISMNKRRKPTVMLNAIIAIFHSINTDNNCSNAIVTFSPERGQKRRTDE